MRWFDDDEFWKALYPYFFTADHYQMAARQASQILTLAGASEGTLLDLCCGPGRHAVEFARLGMRVTGVDLSSFLLDRARERAACASVSVEWVRDDMLHFRRPSAFHVACSIYTSFGYFENADDDLRVLRNVCESLQPGGAFVLEMMGKERLARTFQPVLCTEYPDGAMVVARPRVTDDWCRVELEWMLIKDGRTQSLRFAHNLYSGRELRDRLLAAGFERVQLYGDLAGAPFDLDAPRLVAVARKPA